MIVRPETPADYAAVFSVNRAAFPSDAEARLVDALREQADPVVSWVAEQGGEVVGHILFSPMRLPGHEALRLMALAPMAVRPDSQRQSIGQALVAAGLEACRSQGTDAVIVLGHPEYYPRVGFVPAHRYGLRCPFEVPAEAFMALVLTPGVLDAAAGTVQYHPAFANV